MDKVTEISLLLDFYGQLLTARQYEIIDLHYNGDYSLAEIAENLNISRQGVYDNIKRGKALLFQLEQKLGLIEKFSKQKMKFEQILKDIKSIDIYQLSESHRKIIKNIVSGIEEVMDLA